MISAICGLWVVLAGGSIFTLHLIVFVFCLTYIFISSHVSSVQIDRFRSFCSSNFLNSN